MNTTFRVKEFADLAGVTVRTLQYYDRLGLLKPSGYRNRGTAAVGNARATGNSTGTGHEGGNPFLASSASIGDAARWISARIRLNSLGPAITLRTIVDPGKYCARLAMPGVDPVPTIPDALSGMMLFENTKFCDTRRSAPTSRSRAEWRCR